ncbi:hypothetical protein M433DRAFT_142511 [Acidomyces richmondensis BFW]|nr:hypothetical protein M433DRAFT_142511 [Acidomyces richmondensis BFW]
MAGGQPPFSWEGSASSNNPTICAQLPDEVVTCLENSRYLHLATCLHNRPHVSLMSYTYLPSHPYSTTLLPPGPLVIMTSNPASKKTLNLLQNPAVSLLVHDWVSSRPPNRERSPVGARGSSTLATMLMQMNSAAVSSISATINGEAIVLPSGSAEELWCKEQHLLNNSFENTAAGADGNAETRFGQQILGTSPTQTQREGAGYSYIADQDVRVVVVRIRDGRISDWKGGVKDFVLANSAAEDSSQRPVINGIAGNNMT